MREIASSDLVAYILLGTFVLMVAIPVVSICVKAYRKEKRRQENWH